MTEQQTDDGRVTVRHIAVAAVNADRDDAGWRIAEADGSVESVALDPPSDGIYSVEGAMTCLSMRVTHCKPGEAIGVPLDTGGFLVVWWLP